MYATMNNIGLTFAGWCKVCNEMTADYSFDSEAKYVKLITMNWQSSHLGLLLSSTTAFVMYEHMGDVVPFLFTSAVLVLFCVVWTCLFLARKHQLGGCYDLSKPFITYEHAQLQKEHTGTGTAVVHI